MTKPILDDHFPKANQGKRLDKQAYLIFIITMMLFIVTYGILNQGLVWEGGINTIDTLNMLFSLILFVIALIGFKKGRDSKQIGEPKTKEQNLGIYGNGFLLFLLILVNVSNLFLFVKAL